MGKRDKQKRKESEAARKRRQYEQEFLRQELSKQLREQTQRSDRITQTPLIPLLDRSDERDPLEFAEDSGDELWDAFEQANLEGKVAAFQTALRAGTLDQDYAFEMLEVLQRELYKTGPAGRERYLGLLQDLRQQAPQLYEEDEVYYTLDLIQAAVETAQWEVIPELLRPYATGQELNLLLGVVDKLVYHDQGHLAIPILQQVYPLMGASDKYLPEAADHLAEVLKQLILEDYLRQTAAPQPDDVQFLSATAPYGSWPDDWLKTFVPLLSGTETPTWRPEDFSRGVNQDTWEDNIIRLLAHFIAVQKRAGVPYGRIRLTTGPLASAIFKTRKRSSLSRKHPARMNRGQDRGVMPDIETLDKILGELLPMLGARPYQAVATLELLPAYCHFVCDLGLITPAEVELILKEGRHLVEPCGAVLDHFQVDPVAQKNLLSAWSMLSFKEL